MSLIRVPILRSGRTVWDRTRLPLEEVNRRIGDLQQQMRREGLDALVIYGDAYKPGHVTYLTNFVVFDPRMPGLLILPAVGEMQVMLKVASRDIFFIRDYTLPQAVSSDDLGVSLEQYARQARLARGSRIGTAGARLMPKFLYDLMHSAFTGSHIEERDDLLVRMRRHKSEVERAIMAEGLQKAQRALWRVRDEAAPGTTTNDFLSQA